MSASLLELGKWAEGCSCTAWLPDALGPLWRRCQFHLTAAALGELNLISAFHLHRLQNTFLTWLNSTEREIKFLDKAAQHVPGEVLALPLTVLSPFSSASHFISQSLKSLPQPILPTLSSSEHPSLSGSLLSWVGVDPVLMLVQVKAIRLKLSSPLGVSMLSLSLSTEYLNCQNSFWQSLSVLCFKDQVFPLLFPNQTS